MKQGLSLRVSQHLALTPQLQQSIRLLQLSTLELSQEVDQMLDDNPFLERNLDDAPREEFGLAQSDTPVSAGDRETESAPTSIADYAGESSSEALNDSETPLSGGDDTSWDGDGSSDIKPDDSEWGGDAPARQNNLMEDGEADATELARNQESLTSFLHRQALALRLGDVDQAALRFLIESLNDDGYLEDDLASLAQGLAGDDMEAQEELVHRFTVALRLLQSLEPPGVGATHLGECLVLQLKALQSTMGDDPARKTALRICRQPIDLLARRDVKRLSQLCHASDTDIKLAQARPPLCGRGAQHRGARRDRRQGRARHQCQVPGGAEPRGDATPACARYLRQRTAPAQGRRPGFVEQRRPATAPARSPLVHQEHPAALRHDFAGQQRHRGAAKKLL
jgi:RNA polymerase sigma-54 factor